MTVEFVEYPDREMLFLSLAGRISGELAQHLRVNDSATLCVPGGTTPAPVFEYLSGTDIEWPRVTVVLTDERWVDGEHLRSNGRLLRRHLLKDRAEGARVIDLYTGDPRPEDAVPALTERLAPHLPLTVALLGMGTDMHTASLFPNASETVLALDADGPAVMAINSVKDEPRITLTAAALGQAIHRHLLITGEDKRDAFLRAQELDPTQAPIKAFLKDITVHWAA
ncbi:MULTISPECIES: 6-phosphogluconolactonase [unclassified Paracoccus (in: a-proteobacteria)]|uniref:6-phosphogluconolactonase n=1 Tax=unclassified Paracoccus (in: a-proteobacteria) TaxID=2688777 RepID=UPI0012B1B4E3|nr:MULTISPECIES: 6-phosphogluconolactonase [unclassified Paracoccus (in: a-proteobacteria)]UXU73940.1 6-phosphogluconolactonase [Paracoccus sp. SMMA_5]UXU79827.1 6-phosphogluconolactonase [Paracoccus sp. SMMA_5_TC]